MNHSASKTGSFLPSSKTMDEDDDAASLRVLEFINYSIFTYGDPVALTLGVLGNLAVCLVFVSTPLKARPWSHIQCSIVLVDLLYIISCLVVYLSKRGEPVYDAPLICQATTFTLMVSRSLQPWFVFISHCDRLHSHFTQGTESRRRRVYNTKFALIVVTMLVVAPSVHVMWYYEVRTIYGRSYCVPMRDDMNFHIIMRKAHVIGSIVVPLALTLGIHLFFILKMSLHCFCSVSDDDDEGDMGNLGVYTGYKISSNSSFCAEKTVQLPLQEKKSDNLCEHLLSNSHNVETTRQQKYQNHHLSTIVENSLTSSSKHQSNQTKQNDSDSAKPKGQPNTNNNTKDPADCEDRVDDKFAILQSNYKIDRKQEVAKYILTTTEQSVEKEISERSLHFDNKLVQDSSKLSPDINITRYAKSDNSSRSSTRLHRMPNSKKHSSNRHGGSGNARDSSQVSVFSSSMNHSYTQNSVSYSQYQSYNYTSMVSNVSKSTVIPVDHIFSNDVTSSSVTTVVIGIVMCGLVIPSACIEGKILFLSSLPTTRPSAFAIQKAIFFESLVLFNSVYKILLFVVLMKSFRQAFVWLVISCVPKRFAASSPLCTFDSFEDNTSDIDNIDDV